MALVPGETLRTIHSTLPGRQQHQAPASASVADLARRHHGRGRGYYIDPEPGARYEAEAICPPFRRHPGRLPATPKPNRRADCWRRAGTTRWGGAAARRVGD